MESLLLVPTGVLEGGFVHPLDPRAGSALLHLKLMSVKIYACFDPLLLGYHVMVSVVLKEGERKIYK